MRHEGLTASATFKFSAEGRVLAIRADRYLGGGAGAKLTPWLGSCSEWRTFEGIEVPTRGEVGWALASGYFSYYRWEILDVQFNHNEPYREDTTHTMAPHEPLARGAPPYPQGALR